MFDLLICNGSLPAEDICTHLARDAASITCADGGANKARDLGLVPGTIIGDMDSIDEDTLNFYRDEGVNTIYLSRQDDTDFEKALKHLQDAGSQRVAILGLTGGLLDHTLGNLSILQRYTSTLQVILYDPDYRIDVIDSTTTFSTKAGSRVSIVPLTPATGIHYEGLEYDLPNATVENGVNEGTCNRALDDAFTVTVATGTLMVFRALTADIITP